MHGGTKGNGVMANCNYGLAITRWALQTALSISAEFGIAEPYRDRWNHTLHALVDYATVAGPSGPRYSIAHATDLQFPHRHFSHLLHFFDLDVVPYAVGRPEATAIANAVDHWYALLNGGGIPLFFVLKSVEKDLHQTTASR